MQSNRFTYSRPSHHRYHPYASQSYPVNYHAPDAGADFSSDLHLGGENNNVPYRHQEESNMRFNHRFQGRGRFGHRGRGGHQQQHEQNQHKPWMTDEILEAIRERNELQRKAEGSRSPDDWSIFKSVRNRTNLLINDARRLHEASVSQAESGNGDGQGTRAKPPCAFYCDTCDRSFANDALAQEHYAEHVVCQLDGCKFTAHPKIILKHIEMQHSNNLFSRVKGFDTPEEIAKWKEERRAKFPTADNILKKEEALTERNKRGERLPLRNHETGKKNLHHLKDFSRPERPNRNQPYERRNRIGTHPESRTNSFDEKQTSEVNPPEENNKETLVRPPRPAFTFGSENLPSDSSKRNKSEVIVLESFYAVLKIGENGTLVGKKMMPWDSGTQVLCQKIARTGKPLKLVDEEGSQTSDEEDEDETNFITDEEEVSSDVVSKDTVPLEIKSETNPTAAKDEKVKERSSRLGLVAYSSDSDAESPEEIPTNSSREEVEITVDNTVAVEAVPASIQNSTDLRNTSKIHQKQMPKNLPPAETAKNIRVFKKRQPRVPRLLKKLLENDIRQERNHILQVCCFIIENNYFEDRPASTSEMTSKTDVAEPNKSTEEAVSSSEEIIDSSQPFLSDEVPPKIMDDVFAVSCELLDKPLQEGSSVLSEPIVVPSEFVLTEDRNITLESGRD